MKLSFVFGVSAIVKVGDIQIQLPYVIKNMLNDELNIFHNIVIFIILMTRELRDDIGQ